MIELLGSIGWGLLVFGAITHTWHHRQLRKLLAMHLDHERIPALALTMIEAGLAVAIAIAFLGDFAALTWFALAALVLASGFIVWIARLLLSNSELPCACSFSEAPTTVWSLARAVCVALVGLLVFANGASGELDSAERVATLAVGWAVASAIFVLPEALSWPEASRAILARVDAHATSGNSPGTPP